MQRYEYISKTLEECLKKAEEELKVEQDQIFYKETEEQVGLLKKKKVKIEVIKKQDVIEKIKELIKEITKLMNIEINLETKTREDHIQINLITEQNSSVLIGRNGKTIESLQIIIKNAIQNITGFRINIIIDVENYKDKKNQNLEYYASKIAKEVRRTGIEAKLDPMNSYERRIVHSICNEIEGIKTESLGEEPERYIIIKKQ